MPAPLSRAGQPPPPRAGSAGHRGGAWLGRRRGTNRASRWQRVCRVGMRSANEPQPGHDRERGPEGPPTRGRYRSARHRAHTARRYRSAEEDHVRLQRVGGTLGHLGVRKSSTAPAERTTSPSGRIWLDTGPPSADESRTDPRNPGLSASIAACTRSPAETRPRSQGRRPRRGSRGVRRHPCCRRVGCRPSTFWVMTLPRTPPACSRATARCPVRSGRAEPGPPGIRASPVALPRLARTDELRMRHRRGPGHPVRSAIVRDAAVCRDPGSGEDGAPG